MYICFNRLYNNSHILYGHFEPEDISYERYKCKKEVPFVYEYITNILRLPIDTISTKLSFDCISKNRKMELENEYADSVILFPFAQTYRMLNVTFWDKLVERLKVSGIEKLYTNSNGDILDGTKKSNLPISEISYAASISKRCIGLRSGIFDVLALTTATLDVIYPDISSDCKLPKQLHLYYDLRDLNSDIEITNYSYTEKLQEQLVDEIIGSL